MRRCKADIDNLKKALAATGAEEGFMCSIGPGSFARGVDLYYKTEEEFLFASADAMRDEYKAIVDAGIVLQIDDPSLPDNWDMINPEPPLKEFKKFEQVRMEALNHALRGLPVDRIRFHICWGSWHGPHTTDIPLKDIVDLVLSVNAGAYSVEAGNVRHEHEWRVWQDVKLPDGKLLIPGVVSHATNIVEHPQVVADRIVRYAKVVGRENVIAGHRLRARRPHPSTNRLGQIAGARRRCQARDQRALGIVGNVTGRLGGKSSADQRRRLYRAGLGQRPRRRGAVRARRRQGFCRRQGSRIR